MWGFLKKVGSAVRPALSTTGSILRRIGDTGGKILRTVGAYQPIVSGLVSEIGQHVGRPDVADKINQTISGVSKTAPFLDGVSRLGHSLQNLT